VNYILVVDDSLVDRRVAGQLLEGHPEYHVEYAADGSEALELLEARLPLAIVTDLQMPEMNGMQLIEVVRRRFPTVPVIVMTAYGSEEIAVQALTSGAADYVPKSRLLADLPKSVESVLAITAGQRAPQRLLHCLRSQKLEYELENDLLLIPALVAHLQQAAVDLGLIDQGEQVRFAKALVEALRNAICHGNLELAPDAVGAARPSQPPYCDRRIHVCATFSPQEVRIRIRDDGPGFDTTRVPNVRKDPAHLSGDGGRGLVLIQMFMDEVAFNPAGNEITMVKRAGKTSGGGNGNSNPREMVDNR
jgi:CheY-like chemotaxis protein